MKKIFLLTSIFCCTAFFYSVFAEGSAVKIVLKFKLNDKWISEETSIIKGMQPPVSRSINENKVLKVFPDGAALIITKAIKVEAGESPDKLSPLNSPLLNKEMHKLITPDGRIFLPRPKPAFDESDEQMASEEFEFVDEIELLIKSATTAAFYKKNSSPMDSYLIPVKPIKAGGKVKLEGWTVSRLDDDSGLIVLESRMDPMIKTVHIDAAAGCVMYSRVKQGTDIEMIYRRLK